MIYTVQANDTIYSIAREFSISPDRIIYDNQLDPAGNLAIGQSLLLLRPAVVHTVTEGETLTSIAGLYGIAPIDICNLQRLEWNRSPISFVYMITEQKKCIIFS